MQSRSAQPDSTARPAPELAGPADILGLDNVRLDLPLAGVGSRLLAFTVDQLTLSIAGLLFLVGVISVGALVEISGGWLFAIGSFGVFALQWGYFSACEIMMDGKTPGKLAIGLRTVSHLGGRPSAGAVLARNFLRSFDIFIGLPIMMIDRRWRRLGDLVASTLVVHDRHEAGLHLGRMPAFFGPREIAVTENLLRRADGMEPDVALELSSRLLAWLEKRDPQWFAEAIAGSETQDSLGQLRAVLRPEWTGAES